MPRDFSAGTDLPFSDGLVILTVNHMLVNAQGRLHVAMAESRRNGRRGHAVSQPMRSHGIPRQAEWGTFGLVESLTVGKSFETEADNEFRLERCSARIAEDQIHWRAYCCAVSPRSTGGILGGPWCPRMGKFEQRRVIRNSS